MALGDYKDAKLALKIGLRMKPDYANDPQYKLASQRLKGAAETISHSN